MNQDPGVSWSRVVVGTALLVWVPWVLMMASGQRFSLFADNYFMSLTMVLGSFIAGATSEGGGAVAFPVMTLVFGIAPRVARDFALMIQSVGMIAAGITIVRMRVPIVRACLPWTTLGGAVGVIVGLEYIAPVTPPPFAKMLFTSTWLAFAAALMMINRSRARVVFNEVDLSGPSSRALLVGVGMLGGSITAITGSGLDILTFSLLVLVFRVSEAVATPTSVVLMGCNALVGALYQGGLGSGLDAGAWNYWWVCVPVVVVGAPLGALFIRGRSRLFIARLLIASIVVQFIAALLIVPQSPTLLGFSALVFVLGLGLFSLMERRGRAVEGGAVQP